MYYTYIHLNGNDLDNKTWDSLLSGEFGGKIRCKIEHTEYYIPYLYRLNPSQLGRIERAYGFIKYNVVGSGKG